MAIYPCGLAKEHVLADGRMVLIRPIREGDEAAESRFLDGLSQATKRLRFMTFVRSINRELVHFYTHVDYHDHMAFVCEAGVDGRRTLVGDARYVMNAGGESCEFGVVVAEDWQHSGVGTLLMRALMESAGRNGIRRMEGLVLRENAGMIHFVLELGFRVLPEANDPRILRVSRTL